MWIIVRMGGFSCHRGCTFSSSHNLSIRRTHYAWREFICYGIPCHCVFLFIQLACEETTTMDMAERFIHLRRYLHIGQRITCCYCSGFNRRAVLPGCQAGNYRPYTNNDFRGIYHRFLYCLPKKGKTTAIRGCP